MEIYRLTKDKLHELNMLDDNTKYYKLLEYKQKNHSNYFFPNDLIAFYPNISEQRSRKEIICDFSGARISKGQLYISYRPLIENLDKKETDVLKRTIKCDTFYWDVLPQNIYELERLNEIILNPNIIYTEFDIEEFRCNGEIKLLKLKK